MPDERQEARNDARYGRRQDEDHRGEGGWWSDERRDRDDRQGGGWRGQRDEDRSSRSGGGHYASDWMDEQSGGRGYGGESWRGGYGGGQQSGGGRGDEEMSRGGRYGAWEGSRGGVGHPDHSRGGGFGGPQDAYTRGMQDNEMPAGWRGGLGSMPGGWPAGRGGEQYGRGDYWRGGESSAGTDWGGQGRFGSERWGDESRSQRSFRGLGPKGYQRSDERLREVVCEKLSDDDRVDASDISIEVKNGEVTLQGQVPERSMKYRVEDLIEQCGVREIHNQLRVQDRAQSGRLGEGSSGQSGQGSQQSGMMDKAGSEGRGGGQPGGTGKL